MQTVLDKEAVPLECKETIERAISDLERVVKVNKEADALLNKIKEIVYKKLNPDRIKAKIKERIR